MEYNCCSIPTISDHKPVKSIFIIQGVKIVYDQVGMKCVREEIIKSLYDDIMLSSQDIPKFIMEHYPKCQVKSVRLYDASCVMGIISSRNIMWEIIIVSVGVIIFVVCRYLFALI